MAPNRGTGAGAITRRRVRERIELLTSCGASMEAIAPALCLALHDWVDCAAIGMFWVDPKGQPVGYYHDGAPAELKDFYLDHFDRLFVVPGQWQMLSMLEPVEPSVGRMLLPGGQAWVLASNIHRYLCAPLGHHHVLDMRIDEGRPRAVFVFWRPADRPFAAVDAERLRSVQPLIARSIANPVDPLRWRSTGSGTAHFLTDIAGQELLSIDAEAERLLCDSYLLRQNLRATPPLGAAPAFARVLATQVARTDAPAQWTTSVPAGRIVARATVSRPVRGGDQAQLLVALDHQRSLDLLATEYAAALPLTLMQKRLLVDGLRGAERHGAEVRHGVGSEAMKKHLGAIYTTTGVGGWPELAALSDHLFDAPSPV